MWINIIMFVIYIYYFCSYSIRYQVLLEDIKNKMVKDKTYIDYYKFCKDKTYNWLKDLKEMSNLRKEVHKNYICKHKTKFMIMNWCFVLMIIFNLGAVIITNMLVVKQNPTTKFVEINPQQCELNNYECPENTEGIFSAVLKQLVILSFLIGYLFLFRYVIISNLGFYIYICLVIFLFYTITNDFANDLGYVIGKILWGD